jgi:predicted phosphodiesterase
MSNKRAIVLGDAHCPDHDPAAVEWALRTVARLRPYKVILLGDLVDFNAISRFLKHPSKRVLFKEEIAKARDFIAMFAKRLKHCQVVYLEGNHERRLQKYLWRNAPEFADLMEFTFAELLRVPKNWEIVADGEYYHEQDVLVFHGVKYGQSTCSYNLGRYGVSTVQGHSHRLAIKHRTLGNKKVITAAESGCLCKMVQDYVAMPDWQHGLIEICGGFIRPHLRECERYD